MPGEDGDSPAARLPEPADAAATGPASAAASPKRWSTESPIGRGHGGKAACSSSRRTSTSSTTKLKSSRRWLSAATQGRAEALAAERFASITAGMAADLKAAGFAPPEWPSLRHRPLRAPARRAVKTARPWRIKAPARAGLKRGPPHPGATGPRERSPRASSTSNQVSFAAAPLAEALRHAEPPCAGLPKAD